MLPATAILIAGGAAALGSILSGNSAAAGAKAQARAIREQNQIIRDMLNQQESISKPFRESLYPALQKALGIESYTTPAVTHQELNDSGTYNPETGNYDPAYHTVVDTPEKTNYRQIEGYDPTKTMSELPQYAVTRNPLESQYGVARENIMSSTPTGATGALTRSLSGLETARAETIGSIPSSLYSGLYNTALGLAAGKPELVTGAVGQMNQGAGNLLNYYSSNYSANMANLGQFGQGLGNALYNHYYGGGGGDTTTMNPLLFNNPNLEQIKQGSNFYG